MCDKLLLSIKVPDIISRTPKTLHEFTKWKGVLLRLAILCACQLHVILNPWYVNYNKTGQRDAKFNLRLHSLLSKTQKIIHRC